MTKPEEIPTYIIGDAEKNWHRHAGQFWGLIDGAPQLGTEEQAADELRSHYEQSRKLARAKWPIKRHVLNALVLDLICASFPEGHPPAEF